MTKNIVAADPFAGYGSVCPFCETADIPASATVCHGCGAQKGASGNNVNAIDLLVRLGAWVSTFGFVLAVMAFCLVGPWYGKFGKLDLGLGKSYTCEIELVAANGNGRVRPLVLSPDGRDCDGIDDLSATAARAFAELQREHPKSGWKIGSKPPQSSLNYGTTPTSYWISVLVSIGIGALSLLIGVMLLKKMNRIWNALFGRLADPVWVR